MSTKNNDGHVRISDAEKAMMERMGMGFTRVFRIGLDTLKLWIQGDTPSSCVYLYNTGNARPAPSGASDPSPAPCAQGCPCQACPIRLAFGNRAARAGAHEKDCPAGTVAVATDIPGPGGARALLYLDRIE